ncbi:HNH endonuclease signature motif containing protein [Glycomyces paridis]|nr:HNH endonuclease signature motif containing protein [Glycomyces paridis]
MSTCTPTRTAPAFASNPDRSAKAQAIRSTLDAAAAGINAFHVEVLTSVIDMKNANLHRSAFGFSALRDLLVSQFDFTFNTAGSIAVIARLSRKFQVLTEAATTGAARIDQVAYAIRQLDQTPAMRLFAKTPFRTPAPSPFDSETLCATPEAMVAQYAQHATFNDLRRHLNELWASIAEEAELFDGLGEQSLQRLELSETANGMWHLEGDLSETTGRLLDKYLKTACPPPRQDEKDADEVLPPQANRHAEALHQLLAGYGSSPEAATRHGHTATLDLTVDIETLRGDDTGRLPLLEGKPISVAQARLLACEAGVIPSVFDYETGEAIELGRALRLPNTALRRKLELEQPEGCAWEGCDRPVAWTEAHHVVHWANGGLTDAANLILLCRFHHGRVHTAGWTVEKTGPGRAVITHHEGHDLRGHEGRAGGDSEGCGCADWRGDSDMDAENREAAWDLFPTGLYRAEWSERMTPDLTGFGDLIESGRAVKAAKAARARARERFKADEVRLTPATSVPEVPSWTPTPVRMTRPPGPVDYGEPPFLPCPSGRLLGGWRRTS